MTLRQSFKEEYKFFIAYTVPRKEITNQYF